MTTQSTIAALVSKPNYTANLTASLVRPYAEVACEFAIRGLHDVEVAQQSVTVKGAAAFAALVAASGVVEDPAHPELARTLLEVIGDRLEGRAPQDGTEGAAALLADAALSAAQDFHNAYERKYPESVVREAVTYMELMDRLGAKY